jgi:hypothetical protein
MVDDLFSAAALNTIADKMVSVDVHLSYLELMLSYIRYLLQIAQILVQIGWQR